jgi:fructose-bisphosphate aldolase class 1
LLTTDGSGEYISGAIMFEETPYRQPQMARARRFLTA